MTFDEMYAKLGEMVGKRVRVTILTGSGREATHSPGVVGLWREYLTIGGHLVGGEYDNAVRIEVLQSNGRYAQVAP